jgi:hypothetical protein
MEGRNESKKGNRRTVLTNRPGKRVLKMKRHDNPTHTSEKKNFSSRNINKIIKNVKMQDQKRKNTLKYSDHSRKTKPNEFFFKRMKQKKLLGEAGTNERVSHNEIKGKGDRKRQKKRVKTTRMFTQDNGRDNKEDSIDWTKNKRKNLEEEMSMSEDLSEGSKKKKIKREKKKLELKLETPNSNTRKKGQLQLSGKNKSHSKFGMNQFHKDRFTAKGISKYRLTKTPQGKHNLSNHQLIQKDFKGNRKRVKTFNQSPMLESDGFKRSHRKTRLPKSTRNVPKTGHTFFANSTNNIPLLSDLAERPLKKETGLRRHVKKSKSKSNANRLMGLRLNTFNKKKTSVFKNKKKGLNRTYAHETKNTSGISLGSSQVSSKNTKNTSIPTKFQPGIIPSPLSRQPPKNYNYSYTKNNKLGKSHGHSTQPPQMRKSPDFVQNEGYSHIQQDSSDPSLMYKKNEFYPMEQINQMYNYRDNQRMSKNPHNNGHQELYVGPSFDYKIYSNKNLQKGPVMPLNINQGNWHSQRNSHPNVIELIRVPIQSMGSYPDEDNKLYFQKSSTQGSPHGAQVHSHMNSYGEFPNHQFRRFMPSTNVGSKQFIDSREMQRNSHYYDGVMMGQGMYDLREYQRHPINLLPENQRYFMVRQGSDGAVWVKNNQEQGIHLQKQSK